MVEPSSSRGPHAVAAGLLAAFGGLFLLFLIGVLASSRAGHAVLAFEETGAIGFVLLLLGAVAILVGSLLAALAVHAPRVPLVVAVAPALAVPVVAALGVVLARSRVMGALGGANVAPTLKLRVLAMGTAELQSIVVLGALVYLIALLPAAVGGPAKALAGTRGVGIGRATLALLVGALGLGLLGLAVRLLLLGATGLVWTAPVAGFAVLLLALGALTLDRKELAPELRASAAGAVAVSAATTLPALLAAGVASRGVAAREVFRLLGGEEVDPSARGRLLVEGLSALRSAGFGALLDPLPLSLAALLLVVVGARRKATGALGVGLPAALLLSVGLGLPALAGYTVERETLRAWVSQAPSSALVRVPEAQRVQYCRDEPGLVVSPTVLRTLAGDEHRLTDLDTPEGCRRVATALLGGDPERGFSPFGAQVIAVESGVPWGRLACLFDAMATLRTEAGVTGRDETLWWQVRAQRPAGALPEPFAVLVDAPVCLVTTAPSPAPLAGAAGAPPLPRLHLAPLGWRFDAGSSSPAARELRGELGARLAGLAQVVQSSGASRIALSAEPSTPTEHVLRAAAALPSYEIRLYSTPPAN